ncbi:HAD hydrolase-like protein [Flavobacterium sp. Sd200]|uniref:HAD family hydrolase n=1 Tax=Flavobacterium sp. Sd200 TaxID=2692211 RepID=UPI00136EA94C|nr:HAD family hydrolase [Flavobacterium sp. Sd200]MXN89864.1 HAD hydrolase-like protein [Flavobacterium sp. Sd200]
MNLKVIAFDADDTLFINEPYFEETEKAFCVLMEDYLSHSSLEKELYTTQIANLPQYGYGIKAYILSMIETSIKVSSGTVSIKHIEKILQLGKELLQKPIELIDGVEETLAALHGKYKLVVATKGDLKDQQRKLHDSGLGHYFHHIEVMADKEVINYEKLLKRLDINANEFMMIGNSLKSDVLPVLEVGGYACHIPFHTTWAYERIDHEVTHQRFKALTDIREVLNLFKV